MLPTEQAPPNGNTGGKSPTLTYSHREILIHWFRVVHPIDQLQRIRDELIRYFGEPDACNGRWFFDHGERFSNGVLLLWGRNGAPPDSDEEQSGTLCVDISGSVLDDMEYHDRIALCRFLALGGRVSRLDLAADAYHPSCVGLIDCALESCRRRELCGARRYKLHQEWDGDSLCARGVSIGKRGNLGSGRYIRIYDKGLETGEADQGTWERYEVEFSADCAAEAAAAIFSGSNDWEARAWARINGAISFREVGGTNGNLDRRPFTSWWQKWISDTMPEPTVPRRLPTPLVRHVEWLATQVLPTTARLAAETGMTIAETLDLLCADSVSPRKTDKRMRCLIREWRAFAREHQRTQEDSCSNNSFSGSGASPISNCSSSLSGSSA